MTWNAALEPDCPESESISEIETIVIPRVRDLGGFDVRRALPAPRRRLVGPFVFFDQMGPAEFAAGGGGIDVRPHPHIGIATVTYLYRGEFQHRDSLGSNQMIYPGEVNWMIAGSGIVHSERTSAETRKNPHGLFGIQTWVALPEAKEDTDAAFEHHGQGALPSIESEGIRARLVLGSAYGERAPVKTFSELFYVDAQLEANAAMPLPDDHEDRAAYVVEGSIAVAGKQVPAGQLVVFETGKRVVVEAGPAGARLMLLGGEVLDGPRYLWWNFVSSSEEKIEAAKEAWREGLWSAAAFRLPPDDAEEFIPLPTDV
jgi:redox-sensitive bicupin YhaK (pirin superfamily)